MQAANKPQPERRKTIQECYEQAQERYAPSRAVIALIYRQDVPPKGKLLVVLYGTAACTIATLAISKSSPVAFGCLLICTLAIALLIYQIPEVARRRVKWPGTPKPRPRRPNKN